MTQKKTRLASRGWPGKRLRARGNHGPREAARPAQAPTISAISLDYCFLDRDSEMEAVATLATAKKPADQVASSPEIHFLSECVNSAVEFDVDALGAAEIRLRGSRELSPPVAIAAAK